jgi:hypothetical protein
LHLKDLAPQFDGGYCFTLFLVSGGMVPEFEKGDVLLDPRGKIRLKH